MSATLVSYYPLEFREFVPFLYPSEYIIPPSNGKDPQILVIEDGFYIVDNRNVENAPGMRIEVPAERIAYSLINDFRLSSAHATETAYPAIFYVPEKVDVPTLLKKYNGLIQESLQAQKNWFRRLVQVADDNWQRYRMHRMITDLERLAAKTLGLDREWLNVLVELENCPACNTKVSKNQVVCHQCRFILNEAAYKNMRFADAHRV
jgi:hypothetical protein